MNEQKSEPKKPSKAKKILNIISWVIIGVLVVFDVTILVLKLRMPSSDSLSLFGHQTRIVKTNSMEGSDEFYEEHSDYEIKKVPMNSAIRIQETPTDLEEQKTFFHELKIGDVITFYWSMSSQSSVYSSSGDVVTVTHRIVSIAGSEDNPTYICQGDNHVNASGNIVTVTTQTVPAMMVVGKVTSVSVPHGWFLTNIVQNKYVMECFIVVPCAAVVIYEVFNIVRMVNKDKKEKAEAEKIANSAEIKAKDQELEALRKKVASLEQEKGDSNANSPDPKEK